MLTRALASLTLLLASGCIPLLDGRRPVKNLNVRTGRGFSVTADIFCEITCAVYSQAWDPANGASDPAIIGFTMEPGEVDWDLRVSPDERWAGVVDAHVPHVILALHDYDTGFDWPSCAGLERTRCDMRAYEGLSALQEPGGEAHILSTQAPGDLGLRISL